MNRRAGFTLLELLAASALAAVLLLVLFQVIGSLGRTRAALATASDQSSVRAVWKADLLDTLRRDLANATAIEIAPNRVTLTGNAALDAQTLAPQQEPVIVVYEVAGGSGTRSNLVRRQVSREASADPRGWSELLCADVSNFTLEPVVTGRSAFVRADGPQAPMRVRIENAGGVVLDEVIIVR